MSCIFDIKLPSDPSLCLIRFFSPCLSFLYQDVYVGESSIFYALTCHGAEFTFCNIKPATMLWRIMKFNFLNNFTGFFRRKCFVECTACMGIQVVAYQYYFFCMGILHPQQLFHLNCPINLCTMRTHTDLSFSCKWL